MTPFEFGQLVGEEKTATKLLSNISSGLQNVGRRLMRSGNNMLVNSSPAAAGAISRGGARDFALQHVAGRALRDPTSMIASPFARTVRSGLQGSVMRNVGRTLTGAGMALGKFL